GLQTYRAPPQDFCLCIQRLLTSLDKATPLPTPVPSITHPPMTHPPMTHPHLTPALSIHPPQDCAGAQGHPLAHMVLRLKIDPLAHMVLRLKIDPLPAFVRLLIPPATRAILLAQ